MFISLVPIVVISIIISMTEIVNKVIDAERRAEYNFFLIHSFFVFLGTFKLQKFSIFCRIFFMNLIANDLTTV